MDECSEYLLETESGNYIFNVINLNEFERNIGFTKPKGPRLTTAGS